MKRNVILGSFEQMVLLAALRLGDQAFANRIAGELESRAGKEVSRGTLYAALDRLELAAANKVADGLRARVQKGRGLFHGHEGREPLRE